MQNEDLTTRLRPLYGDEGLAALAGGRVLVLGLGGVGSNCCEALVRGGVGELYCVDRDVVEPSNLNRQAIAFTSTVGRAKVDVMREMAAQINPVCHMECRRTLITPGNLPELLAWAGAEVAAPDVSLPEADAAVAAPAAAASAADAHARTGAAEQADGTAGMAGAQPSPAIVGRGRISYVVDAIDTVTQKLALAEICWKAHIPLISSMGGANKLHPERFEFADIGRTHQCRMARTMRKECARRRIPHLEVLYSTEEPVRPPAVAGSSHDGLSNLGTASFVPPVMGQMIAGRVIRALVGAEPWKWDEG